MKTHTRVIVIGGGVVGCSVLYHLTRLGWSDVVLLERKELTAGSTWHAAGGFHTLNGDPNVARLQKYTIDLYHEIEKITGAPVGMHLTGGINLVGRFEISMPPERSRVIDFLNVASRFVPLFGEDRVTLVQRSYIVAVRSPS